MNAVLIRASFSAALVVATLAAARAAARATARKAVMRRLSPSRMTAASGRAPSSGLSDAINRWLPAPAWLPSQLANAGLSIDEATAWSLWVVSALVAGLGGVVVGGPFLAALALATVTAAPLVGLRASRGRGPARLEATLPHALEAVARALRSGASLRQAVDEAGKATAGPLGGEFQRVAHEAAHGKPLVTALEEMATRRPLPGVRLAVSALCLGAEAGGAQAKAVDGVAATIRERLAVAAEARALASQARMSALVIGVAPIGFGVFAATTDPRTAEFLLHTPAGIGLLFAGLALDGLGWLWMQRLCRVQI